MGVTIQIMEKYLFKGINGREYLQFNTFHQLRAAVSDVYSTTPTAHGIIYSLKSNWGSLLHIYEGSIHSSFMEIFSKGMKRRMPEDLDRNKPVNSLVVNYICNHIEHESVMPDTDSCRNRELFITAAYICMTYGNSLRCYEGFWVDCQRLVYGIHIGKYDRRELHLIVSVMGIFKGGYRYFMHLLPLINLTQSVIRIRVLLEILVSVLKK